MSSPSSRPSGTRFASRRRGPASFSRSSASRGLAHQRADTLSGGERRRLEICRALAASPLFILLDEPFAGIDPIAVADIQRIIEYLKKRGLGILITDHNVRETLRITDRAYIIRDGEVFRAGTPQGARHRPRGAARLPGR